MNEYFAENNGYDVNLFGVVDERILDNGCQYCCIYGERVRNGSNVVASMLHHLFTKTNPAIERSKVLHLHCDSSAVQNENNIVLGYFKCRVVQGYHEKIVWHSMTIGNKN